MKAIIDHLVDQAGCVGGHLLRHEAPAIAQSTEQKIRGSDQFADWVLLVIGDDLDVSREYAASLLNPDALAQLGAQPGAFSGRCTLSFSATVAEIA